jgi:hypothetical protein
LSEELLTAGVDRDSAVDAAKRDLNFFAALSIPSIFLFPYPVIFLAIWQILQTAIEKAKGKDYLAIGIPRGFGKTILLKLYAVYIVLFTDRRFILIVCNTQTLAENFLADVADILDSDNIQAIFGNWRLTLDKDRLDQKKFSFRGRPVVIAALGAGSSLRGLNIKFVRPDCIIMDDMQSREQAESPVESTKTTTWMIGTLLKAASPHRCLYIFVGNMYPFEGSILKKLKYNPTWISFICGAILEDGNSIWPDLKSVDELLTELENDTSLGHPEIFYSEVMNDEEAGTRSGIDVSKIKGYRDNDLPDWHSAGCIIVDPSGRAKHNDDTAIGVMLLYDEKPLLRELKVGKLDPKEQIRTAITLALKYQLPAIIVEAVAYQATLIYWAEHYLTQLGIKGIQVLPIYPGMSSKVLRITQSLRQIIADDIRLHESVRSQVTYQIVHWNPLKPKGAKDDILDIIAYFYPIIKDYKFQIMRLYAIDNEEASGAVHTEDMELLF